VLSDFQISVPELGTIKAKHQPNVLLTSNNTRELSEALKRRCLYLHVDYPTAEVERQIVNQRVPGLPPKLAQQAVELVQRLRGLDLKKHPSVSETIDWARALLAMNVRHLDRTTLETTMNVLLKYESDIQKAKRVIGRDDESGSRGSRGSRDGGNGGNGGDDFGGGSRERRRLRDTRDPDEWRN
jgi:MoxR-like ATPase